MCWGALNIPSVTCDALYMYSTTALCLYDSTLTDLTAHTTHTEVTSVTTSPINACFVQAGAPTCLGAAPPPAAVGRVYATDDGACVVGPSWTSCSSNITFLTRSRALLQMTTSGQVICNQWDDGWECSRAGVDVPLWPFVTNTYTHPVHLDAVALYASNSTLHLCVVDDDDVRCNSYQTHDKYLGANIKGAAVSASHECILYKIESSLLAWVFVILISVLLLIIVFLGIYQRRSV